tara:strand:- start:97 stop:570 length:474 start_codon:yes stop_codon:yes gene_type:complete
MFVETTDNELDVINDVLDDDELDEVSDDGNVLEMLVKIDDGSNNELDTGLDVEFKSCVTRAIVSNIPLRYALTRPNAAYLIGIELDSSALKINHPLPKASKCSMAALSCFVGPVFIFNSLKAKILRCSRHTPSAISSFKASASDIVLVLLILGLVHM